MRKKGSSRKTEIPVGYIEANPQGNRASRRMAAREAKAARRGKRTGGATGGEPIDPLPRS